MTPLENEIIVRAGECKLGRAGTVLTALGIGSCVAMILRESEMQLGCLAHVLLPSQSLARDRGNPAKFAETAAPLAVQEMERCGAAATRIFATLVGGSNMFASLVPAGAVHMGERNVVACRSALRQLGIPVRGESVGGEVGRSAWFDVAKGTVLVRSVGQDEEIL